MRRPCRFDVTNPNPFNLFKWYESEVPEKSKCARMSPTPSPLLLKELKFAACYYLPKLPKKFVYVLHLYLDYYLNT